MPDKSLAGRWRELRDEIEESLEGRLDHIQCILEEFYLRADDVEALEETVRKIRRALVRRT